MFISLLSYCLCPFSFPLITTYYQLLSLFSLFYICILRRLLVIKPWFTFGYLFYLVKSKSFELIWNFVMSNFKQYKIDCVVLCHTVKFTLLSLCSNLTNPHRSHKCAYMCIKNFLYNKYISIYIISTFIWLLRICISKSRIYIAQIWGQYKESI